LGLDGLDGVEGAEEQGIVFLGGQAADVNHREAVGLDAPRRAELRDRGDRD
jgi:hypothetical protein